MQTIDIAGERGRNRTYNLLIKSQLLCQLSYAPARGFPEAGATIASPKISITSPARLSLRPCGLFPRKRCRRNLRDVQQLHPLQHAGFIPALAERPTYSARR